MRNRAIDFMPFINEVDGDNAKLAKYCEQLQNELVCDGQVEPQALVGLLNVTIGDFAV